MVLPFHVAYYQSNLIGGNWALAVVTSVIVNVFEHDVRILVKEGLLSHLLEFLFQTAIYLVEIGQKCLNKYPKTQQCKDCLLSSHGNRNQGT